MTRRGPSRHLAPLCTRLCTDREEAELQQLGDVYELGFHAGEASRWTERFSEGMRLGLAIGAKVGAGDKDFLDQLRRLVEDD